MFDDMGDAGRETPVDRHTGAKVGVRDGMRIGPGQGAYRPHHDRLDPGDASPSVQHRPMGVALVHGWRRRCPACGAGPLLCGYLKLRDRCTVCDTDLSPARADDGPAYLTILIVGHLMAPVMLWYFVAFRPEPLVLATVLSVGCVALSLYLLPRLKGMMVGWQWSHRMHGF